MGFKSSYINLLGPAEAERQLDSVVPVGRKQAAQADLVPSLPGLIEEETTMCFFEKTNSLDMLFISSETT